MHLERHSHKHARNRLKTTNLALERGLDEQAGDGVGVHVGCRAAILKVSIALELHGQWDADGRATVGGTRAEGVDVAGLVLASQTLLVAGAILGDVLGMGLAQLLNSVLNGLK